MMLICSDEKDDAVKFAVRLRMKEEKRGCVVRFHTSHDSRKTCLWNEWSCVKWVVKCIVHADDPRRKCNSVDRQEIDTRMYKICYLLDTGM